MRRFIAKSLLLIMLNTAVGLVVLEVHDARLHYERWQTDSILLAMPRASSFDAVFLGSSHAYLFSRFKENHAIVERELGMRVCNLALPTGGGLRPARFMLEYFFERGNTAKKVVYFLDPFVFFSTGANDAHKFVYFEPLQFSFLKKLAMDGYPLRSILTYIRSKFSYAWFFQEAQPLLGQTQTLEGEMIDPAKVKARMESLYGDGIREANFERYAREFVRIAEYCKARGAALYVIVPPTLLGPEPGTQRTFAWLEEQRKRFGFEVRDLCEAMPERKYYYNLDHLNTPGVERFMRDFVRPILRR